MTTTTNVSRARAIELTRRDSRPVVYLTRHPSTADGTFGRLVAPGFECFTAEPPWKNNQPRLSCIPAGEYECIWHRSPKYGRVYLVADVSGRSHILKHPGNVAGDTQLGRKTHTLGCILLGAHRGKLHVNGRKQRAVLTSRSTVRRFFELMGGRTYRLVIAWGVTP